MRDLAVSTLARDFVQDNFVGYSTAVDTNLSAVSVFAVTSRSSARPACACVAEV